MRYSLRSKLNPTTINVLERIAKTLGLHSRFEVYSVSDFLTKYKCITPEELATNLFSNKQRTLPSNGVLKEQAMMDTLSMMNQYGFDTIDDFKDDAKKAVIEAEGLKLKAQSSGVTW
jgi:hypothetical protein